VTPDPTTVPPPPPPEREITPEEWIAAGQSCCGADEPDEPA
jgi:hypothetical protein